MAAAPAQAQVSLRVGALDARYAGTTGRAISVSPRLELHDGPARGSLEASWSRFDNGTSVVQTGFEASNSASALGGSFGLIAAASANILPDDFSASGMANVALGRPFGPVVAGLGGGIGLVRPVAAGTATRLINVAATISGGARGVRAQLRGQRVWLAGADYDDVTLQLARRAGRLSLEAMGGARLFDSVTDGVWQVAASVQLARPVALEASAGRWPASPEGFARGSYATAGLRISSPPRRLAPAMSVTAAGSGMVRVVITMRGARELHIGGDWNQWTAVPMRHEGGGRWSVELPLGRGAHKFGVRQGADGEWSVPDGVPSLPDDFGGRLGLIVVS